MSLPSTIHAQNTGVECSGLILSVPSPQIFSPRLPSFQAYSLSSLLHVDSGIPTAGHLWRRRPSALEVAAVAGGAAEALAGQASQLSETKHAVSILSWACSLICMPLPCVVIGLSLPCPMEVHIHKDSLWHLVECPVVSCDQLLSEPPQCPQCQQSRGVSRSVHLCLYREGFCVLLGSCARFSSC